jgi:RloB-like protein
LFARQYFEGFKKELRSQRIIVIAEHQGSDPASVVAAAKAAVNERLQSIKDGKTIEDPFEEVWIVFDTEGPQNVQRCNAAKAAIEQCRELEYKTAVSNPCFEFWILLHYVYHVQPIQDGAAACKLLRKYVPQLSKNLNCFPIVREWLEEAIKRSKRIIRERCSYREASHPCNCHPSTQVHLLIDSIR